MSKTVLNPLIIIQGSKLNLAKCFVHFGWIFQPTGLCLQLWMESEESAVRSCPLCQLAFPTGYPDDALIKHIDSHLENSKIWLRTNVTELLKKKTKQKKKLYLHPEMYLLAYFLCRLHSFLIHFPQGWKSRVPSLFSKAPVFICTYCRVSLKRQTMSKATALSPGYTSPACDASKGRVVRLPGKRHRCCF